ncbi:MAG: hypothetical protein IKX20_08475 [Paludibacteraceae bacterium]|nr:hypothetical protein [Paludibacteraceae bacterium]
MLRTIGNELSIVRYKGESDSDYCYRLCYSALALSLLYSARSVEGGRIGISKKAQTEWIQRIQAEFEKHLNLESKRFTRDSNSFIIQCRKAYEETGYLTTDDRGFEAIATYGRTVSVGCGHLYFGIPGKIAFSLGLGLYTTTPQNEASLFDVFLRDTLTSDEYISGLYNPLDFEYRDIDQSTLEFFNPTLKKPPSSSWGTEIRTRRTVARNRAFNTMYRIICEDDSRLLFADIANIADKDCLASYETRRLLFALKEHYGEPAVAWFNKIDDTYYEIKLSAQLPTREYYFLLLSSWPKGDAFNRITFVTTAGILPTIEMMLQNIGIRTLWRGNYV